MRLWRSQKKGAFSWVQIRKKQKGSTCAWDPGTRKPQWLQDEGGLLWRVKNWGQRQRGADWRLLKSVRFFSLDWRRPEWSQRGCQRKPRCLVTSCNKTRSHFFVRCSRQRPTNWRLGRLLKRKFNSRERGSLPGWAFLELFFFLSFWTLYV